MDNNSSFFTIKNKSTQTKARTGSLYLPYCDVRVQTPIFMPVATLGAIKSLDFEDLEEIGYELILHNAYHLTIRPGLEIIKHFNGIKKLTNWKKGLLTDSGGFQIFSLEKLRTITDEGVTFKDPIRGETYIFTPKSTIDNQVIIGSDIIMPLDECTKSRIDYQTALKAKKRTTEWAEISRQYIETIPNKPFLFGITQGNFFNDLRKESINELSELDFDGYSIGGLSVGERKELMYEMIDLSTNYLKEHKARYLMGVGLPANLVESVYLGIDMFDCVIPTRNARHGQAFTHQGKINLHNACHRFSDLPLDELCHCRMCKRYSRGYIHHLLKSKEMSVFRLITYHNLAYLFSLMLSIRQAIDSDSYALFREQFYHSYNEQIPIYKRDE